MSADDIEAINTYIVNLKTVTPEATKLQAQWSTWYNNLNFIEKALDGTFTEASNRRNILNAANLQPVNLTDAADIDLKTKIDRQAAIAHSPDLSPAQKAKALAKNPNIPTTQGVPGSATSHTTVKQGSKGGDVIAWQTIIGVKADGNFGPGTAAATKKWQVSKGLTPDGVVGPKTWSAAIGAPVQEAPTQNIASNASASAPFVAALPSAPFPLVSPSVASHVAAVKSGTTPPPTSTVKQAEAAAKTIVASSPMHTALKIGIPAVGLLGGGWLFGIPGAVIGGAMGFFGSTKV